MEVRRTEQKRKITESILYANIFLGYIKRYTVAIVVDTHRAHTHTHIR